MSEIFVRNSLNSKKPVKFNFAIRKFVDKLSEGEELWVLEVGTLTPDTNGDPIPPYYVHNIAEKNVEDEVDKAISSMCALIDWTVLEDDNDPPYITYFSPEGEAIDITSYVEFGLKDDLPSSGMDLSDMKVTLNNGEVDFDITSELIVKGDPYEYTFKWIPPKFN